MKKLLRSISLTSVSLFIFCNAAKAQWTQTAYNSGAVYSLYEVGTDVFVGAGSSSGMHKLSNNGSTQANISTGLHSNTNVYSITQSGSTIFAGTGNGVYKSIDNGNTWTIDTVGMCATCIPWSMLTVGSTVYAGTSSGVWMTTNNGASWSPAVNTAFTIDKNIYSMTASGSVLLAGTGYGIYRSTDGGNSWTASNTGLSSPQGVYSMLTFGSKIYAGNKNRFSVSTDVGQTWTETALLGSYPITSIVNVDTSVFAGYNSGVSLSNNGGSFTSFSSGLNYNNISCMVISGAYLYVGADGGGVYKRALADFGVTVGVHELTAKNAMVKLYPNPATDRLHIGIANCTNANVEVLSLDGKVMQSIVVKASEADIKTDNLANGVYLIKVTTDKNTLVQKFVKN